MTLKAGRPAHQPTDQTRKMVEVLAGFAITHDKIAEVLGITGPTLRRAYRPQLKAGSSKVEAQLVGNLLKIAGGTDGTALKAIMFALQCRFGWTMFAPAPAAKPWKVGKKEALVREAETGHEQTVWANVLQ